MEQTTAAHAKGKRKPGRRGTKRSKLTINDTKIVEAKNVPAGSCLKGYEEFIVQDLEVQPWTVLFRRQRWRTPSGDMIVAPLPAGINGHLGSELKRFVLIQYHHGQTTAPRLCTLLNRLGLDISRRQIMRLLTKRHSVFVEEAQRVLRAGLARASWITVDDTGARHKMRERRVIGNTAAVAYMRARKLSQKVIDLLTADPQKHFADRKAWTAHLKKLAITNLKVHPNPVRPAWGCGFAPTAARMPPSRTRVSAIRDLSR